jgi:anthranilate/para-aminobenzoate synthase component I
MPEAALQSPVPLASAADLLLRWPADEPLAALVSGGGANAHNAWTILARPRESIAIDGGAGDGEALATLREAFARIPRPRGGRGAEDRGARQPPFDGGWIAALGYGLGAAFEPASRWRSRHEGHPRAVLHWCEDAWCLDHSDGSLHRVGDPPALVGEPRERPWRIDAPVADTSDAHYAALVARTVEYIRAGDLFQANVARRFQSRLSGDPRSFAHAAISANSSWFGAFLDLPGGGALVSMSPELFLRVRPDGEASTRPIKGTRPSSVCASELERSEKDMAELAMIVDLMRNDLGRVARIGSVRVAEARVLETHATVHHGVADIRATLRDEIGWIELLGATFPPGSVTGAPKVRAMQVIDELEERERGFYCGAIGYFARSGHASMSVAIRTALVGPAATAPETPRDLWYHAGCGVVADSDPWAEVAETHAKTRALAQLAR